MLDPTQLRRNQHNPIVIDEDELNFSYTRRKFWCQPCQRSFYALRLDETEVHCPRCNYVAFEFFTQNSPTPRQIHVQNSPIQIEDESTQIREEPQPRRRYRRVRRNPSSYQRSSYIAPLSQFVYAENFIHTEIPQYINMPHQYIHREVLGINISITSQSNINTVVHPYSPFGNLFDNLSSGFNSILHPYAGPLYQQYDPDYEIILSALINNDPNRYGPPPASEESIRRLKEVKFNPKKGDKACAVCQEDFNPGEKVLRLPCKHDYHKECVTKWLSLHNSCPVCREPLKQGYAASKK